eukprot:2487366-Amphidinium_carterae.1
MNTKRTGLSVGDATSTGSTVAFSFFPGKAQSFLVRGSLPEAANGENITCNRFSRLRRIASS